MRWGVVLVLVAACGRLRFEPLDDGDGGTTDGRIGSSDGGTDAALDAAVTACNIATVVTLGTTTVNTCTGNKDLIDGCGPAGTKEIVLSWTPPSTGSYTLQARDQGSMNVSNSTAIANAGCTAIGSCSGILGTTFTGGQKVYIVLEAASGGCVTVDFNIQ